MDFSDHLVEVGAEFVYADFLLCRDEYAGRVLFCNPRVLVLFKRVVLRFFGLQRELVVFFVAVGVNLVEDDEDRLVDGSYIAERLIDHAYVFLVVGVGYVHDMHEYVSLPHLVKRALECLHELCGQLSDESDSVAEQERDILYDDLSDRGVKRCEQLVFGEDVALCQHVHKGALSHVCVAN